LFVLVHTRIPVRKGRIVGDIIDEKPRASRFFAGIRGGHIRKRTNANRRLRLQVSVILLHVNSHTLVVSERDWAFVVLCQVRIGQTLETFYCLDSL
jgi:hypothetical protein